MSCPPFPVVLAKLITGSLLPYNRPNRSRPPADPSQFQSNNSRGRDYTAHDYRAFCKRVARRRARKGYR